MVWLKKFLMHHVLYALLLLVLCFGIFPFIIIYSSSVSIAEALDRVFPGHTLTQKLDGLWTVLGKPYDFLVQTVG